MTKEQALQILIQASEMAPLNKMQHVQLQQAADLLKSLILKEDKSES
jgi:chorismate mutase